MKWLPVKVYHNCSLFRVFKVFMVQNSAMFVIVPTTRHTLIAALCFIPLCGHINKHGPNFWVVREQDRSGLWDNYDNAKSVCFQKPVDINKSSRKNIHHFWTCCKLNVGLTRVEPGLNLAISMVEIFDLGRVFLLIFLFTPAHRPGFDLGHGSN